MYFIVFLKIWRSQVPLPQNCCAHATSKHCPGYCFTTTLNSVKRWIALQETILSHPHNQEKSRIFRLNMEDFMNFAKFKIREARLHAVICWWPPVHSMPMPWRKSIMMWRPVAEKKNCSKRCEGLKSLLSIWRPWKWSPAIILIMYSCAWISNSSTETSFLVIATLHGLRLMPCPAAFAVRRSWTPEHINL